MPTKALGDIITKRAKSVMVIIIIITLVFGAAASQVRFETEEDSFDPKSETSIALDRVNNEFGSENQMTQVIAVANGGNILSKQALMDTLRFQWSLENRTEITETLASNGPPIIGPSDMVYNLYQMQAGVEEVFARTENVSEFMQPITTIDEIGSMMSFNLVALGSIMDSSSGQLAKDGALDLFSLLPTIMMHASPENGSGGEGMDMEDLLFIVFSNASQEIKGKSADILVSQFELAAMIAGGGAPGGESGELMDVLGDEDTPLEQKQMVLQTAVSSSNRSLEIIHNNMQTMGFLKVLSWDILNYTTAGDQLNATMYNGLLNNTAGENSTGHLIMAQSLGNLGAAANALLNVSYMDGDVLAAINNTIENATHVLSLEQVPPGLAQDIAEYNNTISWAKAQIMGGEYNTTLHFEISQMMMPLLDAARDTSYGASMAFATVTAASMNLSHASTQNEIYTNAFILNETCRQLLEEFGLRAMMIQTSMRMMQNLQDIIEYVVLGNASEEFARAALGIFMPDMSESNGSAFSEELGAAFYNAIRGYRDTQFHGDAVSAAAGDTLLASQFQIMYLLSTLEDMGEDRNPVGGMDERMLQMLWLSSSTDEGIKSVLDRSLEYGTLAFANRTSNVSEVMLTGAQNASEAALTLETVGGLTMASAEVYNWSDPVAIQVYGLMVGIMAGEMNNASQEMMGGGLFLMRVPEMSEMLVSRFTMMLSSDLEDWSAEAALIIISHDRDSPSGDRMLAQRMLTTEAQEFEGTVEMRPMAMMVFMEKINDTAQESLFTLFPLAILFIFVVLIINYRNMLDAILSLTALVMAIIWIFGIAVLMGYTLNVIAVAVPVLLVGLGIDYAIHLIMRYREELKNGKSISSAASHSIATVGGAIALTTATTMIGFLSNTTSSIAPIRDFGLLTALGILCALIVMITFVPSVKVVLDTRKAKKNGEKAEGENTPSEESATPENSNSGRGEYALSRFLGSSAYVAEKHPFKVLAVVAIITLLCAYGATQLQTEFDIMDFLPENLEESKTIIYLVENFNFSDEYVYVYVRGDMTRPDVLQGLYATSLSLRNATGATGEVPTSPATVLRDIGQTSPTDQGYNHTLVTAIQQNSGADGIPHENLSSLYDLIRDDDAAWSSLGFVLHYDEAQNAYASAVIRIRVELRGLDIDAMAADMRNIASPLIDIQSVEEVKVTGGSILGQETMDEINNNQIRSLFFTVILCLVILTGIMWWLDRSPLLGVLTVIPICIVIVWMWGSMYILGFKLNVMTNMIAALSVGLGLTYAIHVTHRFKEELDKTGDPELACREAVTRTGSAITGAAVTTMGGFFILSFSVLHPLKVFGQITALAVLYGYIASVFVLPTLLVVWAKHSRKRHGKSLAGEDDGDSLEEKDREDKNA